jgi:hypothetical protein
VRNVKRLMFLEVFGYPLAKAIVLVIAAVVLVIILPLLLLPYLGRGRKLRPVPWLYFFVIGMAFMAVEVVLIQRYTLFVGPTAYSIATILLALLVASGLGSRFSGSFPARLVFVGIALWLVLEVLILRRITFALWHLALPWRLAVTVVLVFPLGFLMGMPFPKGAGRVGELVDWGLAVNGAASVLGSTLILLVAFSYGLGFSLLVAALLYALAFLLFSREAAWR